VPIVKVIDSSILAKYLLKEEGWRRVAETLRERPFTLDLAVKETANALWRRVVLLRDIDVDKASTLLDDLLKLKKALRVEPQDRYLRAAFEIAITHRITVYDALFIAQARAKNAVLVTADEKQYSIARGVGVEPVLVE